MTFQDTECPVCHRVFTADDDVVVCPDCGTPHHRECWQQTGHCANRARHAGGYAWQNPNRQEEPPKPQEALPHKKVRCANCGAWNEPGTNVCTSCGERVNRDNRGDRPMGFGFGDPMLNVDTVPENVLIDGIPAEETAAYVRENSTRYLWHFISMDRRDSKINWNWAAALFRPFWLFYRKMYGWGFLYLAVFLVIIVLTTPGETLSAYLELLQSVKSIEDPAAITALYEQFIMNTAPAAIWQQTLSSAFQTISMVLFGLFGDELYKRKVKKSILALRPQASSMEEYMALLQKKGGVSILMLLLTAVLSAAVSFLGVFLSYLLSLL